ncbi:unnamed protein product [Caenorhabditis auriculariae]|uniref:Retinoblastoma-associated protein B-box domain-containing protein n=1 Tax=Caenorhabditis auriculariae TaxID=2777116 RepID=A0A8S1HM88_9PELO|nr:unnamed protein product [Caenorhabditis auriculariae]
MECRHLDQNLLCCVYVITKIAYMEITFTDIMAHYRRQPQANSRVYREVSVQSLDDATQNEDSNSRDSALSRASSSRGGVIPPPGVNSAPPTPDQAEMGDWSRVDIIKYYNEVFRVRVEDFVMQMDAKKVEILPMPVPKAIGASPFKKQLTSRVLIQTLQKGSFEINYHGMLRKVMSFSLQRSPRKDLMALNKKISMIHTARKSPIKSTMSIKKEMA